MKKYFSALAVLGALFIGGQANAGGIGILGGMNFYSQSWTPTTTTSKAKSGLAGGLFYGFSMPGKIALELGAMYVQKKFDLITPGAASYELAAIQIPLILRVNFLPILDVGIGGYYEIGMSGLKLDGVETTYADQNLKNRDFGALASLRFKFMIGPKLDFILDGRYLMGLSEQLADTSSGGSLKNRSIQAYAGLGIGL